MWGEWKGWGLGQARAIGAGLGEVRDVAGSRMERMVWWMMGATSDQENRDYESKGMMENEET